MADAVHQLLATEVALAKLGPATSLGRRGRAGYRATAMSSCGTLTAAASRTSGVVGSTDGGRVLTLVTERTIDPTTWLIVTG